MLPERRPSTPSWCLRTGKPPSPAAGRGSTDPGQNSPPSCQPGKRSCFLLQNCPRLLTCLYVSHLYSPSSSLVNILPLACISSSSPSTSRVPINLLSPYLEDAHLTDHLWCVPVDAPLPHLGHRLHARGLELADRVQWRRHVVEVLTCWMKAVFTPGSGTKVISVRSGSTASWGRARTCGETAGSNFLEVIEG